MYLRRNITTCAYSFIDDTDTVLTGWSSSFRALPASGVSHPQDRQRLLWNVEFYGIERR
jgi:hypothetical protein